MYIHLSFKSHIQRISRFIERREDREQGEEQYKFKKEKKNKR